MESLQSASLACLRAAQALGLAPFALSCDGRRVRLHPSTCAQLYSCAVALATIVFALYCYVRFCRGTAPYLPPAFLPQLTVVVLMFVSALTIVISSANRHPSLAADFLKGASTCQQLLGFAGGGFESRGYRAFLWQATHALAGCAGAAVVLNASADAAALRLLLCGLPLRLFGEVAKFSLLSGVLLLRVATDALNERMLDLYRGRKLYDRERFGIPVANPEPDENALLHRTVFLNLCDMSDNLNHAFGWQMVTEGVYLFSILTFLMYELLSSVMDGEKGSNYLVSLGTIGLWEVTALIALLQGVRGFSSSQLRCATLADRLALQSPRCSSADALSRLAHARCPVFHARGFFKFDEDFLKGLVTAVVTFALLFIVWNACRKGAVPLEIPPCVCPTPSLKATYDEDMSDET